MISLLLSIVIAFIAWTFFALMNKGSKDSEIKSVLRSLNFHFKSTLIDLTALFLLLLKDAFQPSVNEYGSVLDEATTIDILASNPELLEIDTEYSACLKNVSDYSSENSSEVSANHSELLEENESQDLKGA